MSAKQATLAPGTVIPLALNASATSQPIVWQGGTGAFTAEATWGGGSVALQLKSDNGTYISVGADTTLTSNGAAGFVLPAGTSLRVSITTATAVFAYVVVM